MYSVEIYKQLFDSGTKEKINVSVESIKIGPAHSILVCLTRIQLVPLGPKSKQMSDAFVYTKPEDQHLFTKAALIILNAIYAQYPSRSSSLVI